MTLMMDSVLVCALSAALCGCTSPTASIQPEVDRFKSQFSSQIVTVEGRHRQIRFAWAGDSNRRPLIFVHGSPGGWEGWAHFLLDENLQKKFHIMAIDRPGYGGSGHGDSETSLDRQADEVAALIDQNHSGLPAILVGHSFGGPVVARVAMALPDRIAGVIFVASSVDPSLEKTKWFQYPANWWPIKYLIPADLRVCNEEILTLKVELEKMEKQWRQISAQVAVVQGMDDDLVPKENVDFILAHLEQKHLVSIQKIESLNHFVPWKRPDAILKAIDAIH